jgi:hypothetical protein
VRASCAQGAEGIETMGEAGKRTSERDATITTNAGQLGDDAREAARDLLRRIPAAASALLDELEAAGLTPSMRRAPGCDLHALDRGLPRQSVDDLLAECEAFAFVSGPSALAQDDTRAVRDEAEHFFGVFETLLKAGTRRSRGSWMTGASTSMQAPLLRSALGTRETQDALYHLTELFDQLATAGEEEHRARRGLGLLPAGRRVFTPVLILTLAVALIAVLLGAIGLASGKGPGIFLGEGASNVAHTATSTSGSSATATPQNAQTPTAGRGSTPTPRVTATASGAPRLTVAPQTVEPCMGVPPPKFTISYSTGQGSATWTAKVDNAANAQLSLNQANFSGQVSGTLQPGQRVDVYVQAGGNDTSGQITIQGPGSPPSVMYDSTNC